LSAAAASRKSVAAAERVATIEVDGHVERLLAEPNR
jgi:hypothetical protein